MPPAQVSLQQVCIQQRDELPIIEINNQYARATIALQGAQVLEFTPRGAKPVIWLSERAEFKHGQGQRGGIPICWPWFGALERNPESVRSAVIGDTLPAHGLVRNRIWSIRSIHESTDKTDIILSFTTDCITQQQWLHAAELLLKISVGRTLTLTLSTHNLSEKFLNITQALHTYFSVSSIDNVYLSGFENTRYIDTLDDWHERRQRDEIHFNSETDRIYLDVPHEVQLHDEGWNRTIQLRTMNSRSAVVWNPWVEKSTRLTQFAPDAWREMVCIETANVLDDRIELAPFATHTLTLEIACAD